MGLIRRLSFANDAFLKCARSTSPRSPPPRFCGGAVSALRGVRAPYCRRARWEDRVRRRVGLAGCGRSMGELAAPIGTPTRPSMAGTCAALPALPWIMMSPATGAVAFTARCSLIHRSLPATPSTSPFAIAGRRRPGHGGAVWFGIDSLKAQQAQCAGRQACRLTRGQMERGKSSSPLHRPSVLRQASRVATSTRCGSGPEHCGKAHSGCLDFGGRGLDFGGMQSETNQHVGRSAPRTLAGQTNI